jgi:hypothetical protein
VIVDFPGFHGFPKKDDPSVRLYPFPNKKTLVPIYRDKFIPLRKHLSTAIIKKQTVSECYRIQFPLDLCRNCTAHRAQGSTFRDCLVSVDINLDSPDAHLPADVSSIFYVACTRVVRLQDLFVSQIFPTFWNLMGKSDVDMERRLVCEKLREKAETFSIKYGKLTEVKDELNWVSSYTDRDRQLELESLDTQDNAPVAAKSVKHVELTKQDLRAYCNETDDFEFCMNAVLSERHVGLDQGRRNFALVVVDKIGGDLPTVVFADNYNLELKHGDKAPTILMALKTHTPLLDIMQCSNQQDTDGNQMACGLSKDIDRVIVNIEQMSAKNSQWKEFGINLGTLLQQQVRDINKCVVKLSQPHIHRSTGPMFKIGNKIVKELQLEAPTYGRKRTVTQVEPQPSTSAQTQLVGQSHAEQLTPLKQMTSMSISTPKRQKRRRVVYSDVEPSSDSEEEESTSDLPVQIDDTDIQLVSTPVRQMTSMSLCTPKTTKRPLTEDSSTDSESESNQQTTVVKKVSEYKKKKLMSAKVFKYFIDADDASQVDMGIRVDTGVQEMWRKRIMDHPSLKLDDAGE